MKYGNPESSKLEFKERIPKSSQIFKTVIAFSNTNGGKIIIGVKNDGEVIGITDQDAHEMMEWLDKSIYEACVPPIVPLVYQQRLNNKVLLIIELASGTNKPYYLKSLGLDKGTYVRLGRSTVQANADMIEELKWQARGISFDHLPIYHANREAINISEVESFLSSRRNGAKVKINDGVLFSYYLLVKEHNQLYPSVGGLLLFGKDPQYYLTESYILCSHFSGISGREALASREIKGTLFEQFDTAYDFIVSRLNKSFKIIGKIREEKLEIPPQAIREVLMNAILHRNYNIKAPIKIAIYEDRIEVFSPGSFHGPVEISNLESGITYVRNTAIAKVLWEAKYIEKMGSGFIELFKSYREYNLYPPNVIEGANFVKCILPRKVNIDSSYSSDEEKVLNLFRIAEEISRSDIVEQLKIPKTTAGRILASLESQGKVIRTGRGRITKYRKRN